LLRQDFIPDTFGYGQALMSDGSGVHYGASEPIIVWSII
jgi:hypothetical protein